MERRHLVQPGRIGVVEIDAGAAIGEHRPLAGCVDQRHDRAGRARPTHRIDVDALGADLRNERSADRIVADLSDEPAPGADRRGRDPRCSPRCRRAVG